MTQRRFSLAQARPVRFPGERRRHGTNWGLCDPAGQWLCLEGSLIAFNTARNAQAWVQDPAAFGKGKPMAFQHFEHDALVQ